MKETIPMTATRTTRTPPAAPSAPSFAVDAIHAAMLEAVERFVVGAELSDTNSAARQPVSIAAAYRDLCTALGMPAPRFVRVALDS